MEHVSRIPCSYVQLFPKCILGTLHIPHRSGGIEATRPLSFYFTDSRFYLIGEEAEIEKILHRTNHNPLPERTGSGDLLYLFINQLMDDDNVFLMGLEKSLSKMEEDVFQKKYDTFPERLNTFRKELRAYKNFYDQLYGISLNMQANPYGMLAPEQCDEYRHFGSRAAFIAQHIKDLLEYSMQIKDVYQAQIDMKQTRAMNILTVVSAIFLPLSLLTGWYGMNFIHMSELQWAFSYPAVIVIAVLIVAIEIWIFKKKDLFK